MRNTIFTILLSSVLSFTTMAEQNTPAAITTNDPKTATTENIETKQENKSLTDHDSKQDSAYEKIIEDFKDYALKVKPEIREEIKTFREKMDDINADKGKLYKALSSEAKVFLKKEREFKKKLKQKIDNKQTPDDQVKDTENTTPAEKK